MQKTKFTAIAVNRSQSGKVLAPTNNGQLVAFTCKQLGLKNLGFFKKPNPVGFLGFLTSTKNRQNNTKTQ